MLNLASLNHFVKEVYGAFGKAWVEFIVKHKDRIKETFRMVKKELAALEGLENFVALLLTSLIMIREFLKDKNIGKALEEWIKTDLITSISQRFNFLTNPLDSYKQMLISWVFENKGKFAGWDYGDDEGVPDVFYGLLFENKLFLTPLSLRSFCEQQGIPRRRLLQTFYRSGQLLVNKAEGFGYIKRVDDRVVSGYCFIIPELERKANVTTLPEDIDEDIDSEEAFDDFILTVNEVNEVTSNQGEGEDKGEDEDKEIALLRRRIGLCVECAYLQLKDDVYYCPKWKYKIEAKMNKCPYFLQKSCGWNGGKDKQTSEMRLQAN
jgi:hypothetical protein